MTAYYKKIDIIAVDVDGSLTDGSYYYSDKGTLTKKFSTNDGMAIYWLLNMGLNVVVITSSTDKCITYRFARLMKKHEYKDQFYVLKGISNKDNYLPYWYKKSKLYNKDTEIWQRLAFFGDSYNDLTCIKLAAHAGCPNNSVPIVQKNADFTSDKNGGSDAFMDFILNFFKLRGT